jgi:transcriptional regulator with XRE-family HTH domain
MQKTLVNSIAFAIRYYRKAQNMSQEELANRSGLDRTYISGVERGVRNITLESLEQIITALRITPAVFFNLATCDNDDDVSNK